MNGKGFSLNFALPDLWQQEAVRALRSGSDAVVDAPTGAGKTWIFELLISGGWKGQAVYTVPTRALANDKRLEWQRKGWHVGIVTGDLSENPDAPVVVATLETQRERLLSGEGPSLLVIDEYQMLGDPTRGPAYELAIASAPAATRLLLLSGSVGNAREVTAWMQRLGRRTELVSVHERPVPLEEMPLAQLPRQAPKSLTGFWPRLAASVLLSGLGPLLIFAPRRRDAEAIARRIAAAVPTPDPLPLTREQERILGPDYAPLLRQRVACHHSGMSYQQRAGIIEPLAKAGQLRVVAATTGLAAGINFSMRSVMVAETIYFDGRMERQIAPDELLQMFGRAGRRGLDESGYVISAARSPRLSDASQRSLRRSNQIDWPTLLRIMSQASRHGQCPLAAATAFCASLFSRQRITLGFEPDAAAPADADADPATTAAPTSLFNLRPGRTEILNAADTWEPRQKSRHTTAPLASALVHHGNRWVPALACHDFMLRSFPTGRLCRLPDRSPPQYGRELAIATLSQEPDGFSLTKPIRRLAPRHPLWSRDAITAQIIPALTPLLAGGSPAGLVMRGNVLSLLVRYDATPWPVYLDSGGNALVAPPERTVSLEPETTSQQPGGLPAILPPHSAAFAWRQLGLVSPNGTPTRRGEIFSLFSGGEGLAIAAALEDSSYPTHEITRHLANVRGGFRFSEASLSGGSERLAMSCLHAYGAANHDGYLDAGLPSGYGEGTAEAIALWLERRKPAERDDGFLGEGDRERAFTEWISLLRQIAHAPDIAWDRWTDLKQSCQQEIAALLHHLPSRDLPPIPAIQLHHATRHHAVAL